MPRLSSAQPDCTRALRRACQPGPVIDPQTSKRGTEAGADRDRGLAGLARITTRITVSAPQR